MFSFRDIFSFKSVQNPLVIIALLLGTALIASCGGENAPEQTTGPGNQQSLQVSSGMFDVTSRIVFDTCTSTASQDGEYEITIDGADFSMGDSWIGSWNASVATGAGESEHDRFTHRGCTVTEWTEVSVEFTSEDEFKGEVVFRRRVIGSCNTPCVTTWLIEGVRKPATP